MTCRGNIHFRDYEWLGFGGVEWGVNNFTDIYILLIKLNYYFGLFILYCFLCLCKNEKHIINYIEKLKYQYNSEYRRIFLLIDRLY